MAGKDATQNDFSAELDANVTEINKTVDITAPKRSAATMPQPDFPSSRRAAAG